MTCKDPILLDLPDILEGPRVRVRPYQPGDGAAFFRAIDVHREALSTWLGWLGKYPSVDHAEAFVRRQAAGWLLREYLGGSGYHAVDWHTGKAELGYFILPPFESRNAEP